MGRSPLTSRTKYAMRCWANALHAPTSRYVLLRGVGRVSPVTTSGHIGLVRGTPPTHADTVNPRRVALFMELIRRQPDDHLAAAPHPLSVPRPFESMDSRKTLWGFDDAVLRSHANGPSNWAMTSSLTN